MDEIIYRTGRRTYERVLRTYPNHIVLLEDEDKYWTYNDSADSLANLLGLTVYHNAAGESGLTIEKKSFSSAKFLIITSGRDLVVRFHDKTVEYTALTLRHVQENIPEPANIPQDIPGLAIEEDIPFSLFSSDTKETEAYIITANSGIRTEIHRENGGTELITVPLTSAKGKHILSPNAPLARIALGKTVNDRFTCNGIEYRVTEITD